MIKKSLLSLSFILLTGCSFFSKKVESIVYSLEEKNVPPTKINKKNLHCMDNNKIQLMLEDETTLKYYHSFLGPLFESKDYSFIQKSAMLSLIEMSRRPDVSSPSARLQYFLRYNRKVFYFDFHPLDLNANSKMSYLKGLDFLLKNFDPSKGLNKLADSLDQLIPHTINVSPELENFLQFHKNELAKSETLADAFMKGDEVLTKHESFKRISYKKVIAQFYKENQNADAFYESSKNSLFPVDSGHNGLSLKCNSDINRETYLKDSLLNISQIKSHYFALKDGENFFIAVSSTIEEKRLKNYKETYLLKIPPAPLPLPVCQFITNQEDVVLFSTAGRNPAQHLKHLVNYDISMAESYQSLEELLNFSRHLFLNAPDRILYESKRGRKSQLDFFLSMNFPIYHVDTLGDIIGSAGFTNRGREDRSLIIDDRSPAKLWCSP